MNKSLLLLAFCALAGAQSFASQPLRRTVTRTLADGTTVSVERRGDSRYSWWQAVDGQSYEMTSNHTLVPISRPEVEMRRQMNASTPDGLGAFGQSGMGVVASLGHPVIPVVLMAYSDLDFLPEDNMLKIDRFLNEEGYHDESYAVGSVADYFEASSTGFFRPRFEVVAKVTLSHDHQYYGGHVGSSVDARRGEAIREAVALAEQQGVDFSRYATDGHVPLVSVIHAGPGEQEDYGEDYGDFFWAHFSQTSINTKNTVFDSYLLSNETLRDFDNEKRLTAERLTGIGTFCHEFGHALGLPDMYDVNGDTGGAGKTPGYWDVMDYQFMYDGYRPMEYSAYERSMMGWMKITDLTASSSGVKSLAPLGTGDANRVEAYRMVNPANPNEYFLFENRHSGPFYQANFLGEGMLVWHIFYDSSRWASNTVNIDASQQRVRVVPADKMWQDNKDLNKKDDAGKRYTFTGDLFPGYARVTTFDSSIDKFFDGSQVEMLSNIVIDGANVSFLYGDPGTVGVDRVSATTEAPALYDLQGRRTSAAAPGLYIVNGRKVKR